MPLQLPLQLHAGVKQRRPRKGKNKKLKKASQDKSTLSRVWDHVYDNKGKYALGTAWLFRDYLVDRATDGIASFATSVVEKIGQNMIDKVKST
jgi:hypothetical protein